MSHFRRKSRMVEISKSGSGEGLGWETGRGYSTTVELLWTQMNRMKPLRQAGLAPETWTLDFLSLRRLEPQCLFRTRSG